MGLSHDRGATNKCSVLDAYNFGYRDPSAAFRSIMAYNCRVGQCDNIQRNGCSRIQRFSTPDQTFGGKPLGTTKENAARWLNEVASEISDYYEKKPLCSSENDCVDHAGDPCYVTTCDGVCTYTDICSIPSDGVCGRDKVWLQVDVQLDNYPAETSWTLKDECSDEIVVSMTGNNGDNKLGTEEFNFRTYSQQKTFICVDRKQYIFTINDTYGDGICCSYGIGYYSIEYEGMTGSAITGGSFQDTQSHAIDIGSCTVSTTSRPSAAPTLKPSKPPTMNPTQTPTKSPVSSPPTAINLESNFCVDDSTFIFKLDDGSTQNCSWLQRNVIEIEKYCNRGHIKGACRASCNFCLCTDDSSYKFRLTNNGKRRRCNWLVKNSRNIQVRRENYCFASDLQSASSDVGNACIESCGFCKG
jgi:cell division septation protein DedD